MVEKGSWEREDPLSLSLQQRAIFRGPTMDQRSGATGECDI